MKKAYLLFLLLAPTMVFSQFKLSGYFDKEIGVSYKFLNKLQVELRFNDDSKSEFNSELSILFEIITKERYNLNLGFGISTYPFHSEYIKLYESTYIPFQVEIIPFQSTKNFAFVLETAYHQSDNKNDTGIRNSIAIRYIFN